MNGIIINYRRARHHQKPNHVIIQVDKVTTKDAAAKLVGKKVTWNTGKKDMVGKVASSHGNKGAVRAVFETGVPGQAIGKKVNVA